MDVIEKETIKEVPACEYYDHYGYGSGRRGNLRGIAGTGLGLGIAGTVLGGLALLRQGGLGLFGNGWSGNNGAPQNVNINTETTTFDGVQAPSNFQIWEKECEDTIALQKSIYDLALLQQNQRFADRQTLNAELFGVYKSQIDADFGLYKSNRDNIDGVLAKQNADAFALYKSQRDGFDILAKRISDLETKQAVNDAVDPWRAKVLDMQIKGVAASAQAGIALEAERRCCADNKIVTYVNGTFYPIEVAGLTVTTDTTAKSIYNPLCGCSCPFPIQ
ncbi:MAG: hypothetical protein U0K68_01370 [Agathobacter sp.]|nr:hypothetical protein [Agathobacter sp.]